MNKYLKAYKFNQKQIIKYIKAMVKSLAVNDTDYLEYKNILFEIEQNVAFKNESHYQYLLSKVEHWDKKIYFFLKESKKLWDWGKLDVKAKKWGQIANRLSEMIDDLRDRTKRLENEMKGIKKVVYEDRS